MRVVTRIQMVSAFAAGLLLQWQNHSVNGCARAAAAAAGVAQMSLHSPEPITLAHLAPQVTPLFALLVFYVFHVFSDTVQSDTPVTDPGCCSSSCRDSKPTNGQACTSGSTRASYLILLTRPSLIHHHQSTTLIPTRATTSFASHNNCDCDCRTETDASTAPFHTHIHTPW